MIYNVPYPAGLAWQQWAAAFINNNPGLLNVPIPTDDWRLWASEVCGLFGILGRQVPWPGSFSRWQDWATRLSEALVAGA